MNTSSHNAFYSWIKQLTGKKVPWTADLDYWISGREQDGSGDPAWRSDEGYLELNRELKIFPYYKYDRFWCGSPAYDKTVKVDIQRAPDAVSTTWTTPVGTISETQVFLKESCSWAYSRHAVQNGEDLKVLAYIIQRRHMVPDYLLQYRERLGRWMEYGGLPPLALPRSPLPAMFYEWAGIVNGVYLMMDFPEIMEGIFRDMLEQENVLLNAIAEVKPPLVHFADNISGDNMTGYFDRYMKEGYEERMRILHAAGVSCVVHLDGVIEGIIGKLAATGIDALEALTPAPGGTMPVEHIREAAGRDDIVLWGGVPGIMFAKPYTWDDLRRHIDRVLAAWEGTPFILGVADQVPADGDAGLVLKISEYLQERE